MLKSLLDIQQDIHILEKNIQEINECVKSIGTDIETIRNSSEDITLDYSKIEVLAKQIDLGEHPLSKLKSTLPEDAFTQVLAFLGNQFLRRRFLKNTNKFSIILNYLPFKEGVTLHLNKLESPLPSDALCQVWLKSAQWFWRRR